MSVYGLDVFNYECDGQISIDDWLKEINMEICVICGRPKECDHHLIFGRSQRSLCDDDKLYIPMCNNCHNMSEHIENRIHGNSMAERLSKMLGQALWEKEFYKQGVPDISRQSFIDRYGRSYL